MPFKSRAQEKWAFANKKPWAKEWASKTKNIKSLPNKKSKIKHKNKTVYESS